MRREYPTPVEDLWQACTDPERMRRWFLPVTGDLRLGGSYQLEGNANGEILTCEPPRRLRVSWRYPGHPDGEVELRLSPASPGSTLELEHAIVRDEFPTEARGIGPGWEPALLALDGYLRGTLPPDLAEKWRAGEIPPDALEMFDQSTRIWDELIGAATR